MYMYTSFVRRSKVLWSKQEEGGGGGGGGQLPLELEGDERLKNIEPRMVELIMNEVGIYSVVDSDPVLTSG